MDLLHARSLIDTCTIAFNSNGNATLSHDVFSRLNQYGLIDHTTEVAQRPAISELLRLTSRYRGLGVQARLSVLGFSPFALFGIILPDCYEQEILPLMGSARDSDLHIRYDGNCQFWMEW